MAPIALQGLLPTDLAERARIDLVDARRIVSLVHRTGEVPTRAPATIRRVALDRARELGHVPTLEVVEEASSQVDPFVKYVVRLGDDELVETVRIPLEKPGRFVACVSSQVGCALACAFCATGRIGLRRNLSTWEIVEQVRLIRARLPAGSRVHGVVFQGMGEPLANVDHTIEAISVMSEPCALAIDMRNITVCTAGLPSGIRKLTQRVPAVRIGLSIGSVRGEKRRRLMPIDAAHSLEASLEALGEHTLATGYAPMWAYTLLDGENDSDDDARELADRMLAFEARYGSRPRLSLIPYNSLGDADPFRRTPLERQTAFRDVLRASGAGSILRYSGGGDVAAACGQLASRSPPEVDPRGPTR